MVFQWIGVCVAAAMICAMLRTQRPELATAVSLAVGAAVLAMLLSNARAMFPDAGRLWALFSQVDGDIRSTVLRAVGIALIAELGAQLCRDAGESALAGRVALIERLSILALCAPLLSRLVESLERFAP